MHRLKYWYYKFFRRRKRREPTKDFNCDYKYVVIGGVPEKRYACRCCGYYTMEESPRDPALYPGTHEICSVCFWQDDSIQVSDPDYAGGANRVSLNQAKENFKKFGAVEEFLIQYVRKPREGEADRWDMRMLDEGSDKKVDNLLLLLTRNQARQMVSDLQQLLECDPAEGSHAHLNNADYTKEITLAIYDQENVSSFHDRVKRLILSDE